ncbi:Uncharacterised protein [Mycobacteroides abscessus subsp. massiliense]|nr:Uncharacterised protein [Mycobacteroides abscessus subsp. massiliense]
MTRSVQGMQFQSADGKHHVVLYRTEILVRMSHSPQHVVSRM